MAGLIEFGGDRFWSVATWAYLIVRDHLHATLTVAQAPTLYSRVARDVESGQLFIDAETLERDELKVLQEKVQELIDHYRREGPSGFTSPEAYEGLLSALTELAGHAEAAFRERGGASPD